MRQKIIGTWYSGHEQIELVLREGTGGEFFCCPEKKHVPRIKIGGDYENWWEVVNCLLHEVVEFNLMRLSCRYEPLDHISKDLGAITFHMSHGQFSEAIARSAEYVVEAVPKLAIEWKKWKKS